MLTYCPLNCGKASVVGLTYSSLHPDTATNLIKNRPLSLNSLWLHEQSQILTGNDWRLHTHCPLGMYHVQLHSSYAVFNMCSIYILSF